MSREEKAPSRVDLVTDGSNEARIVAPLDDATRAIVRLAGGVASADESALRPYLTEAAQRAPGPWVEEVLLQSYLFAGFPRALNAMREWRRISGLAAPDADAGERLDTAEEWNARGQDTCATVYGPFYERLRHNIRSLHPALDAWMITEGYGKVLSRPALDLGRRELCIVSACASSRQDRQLHSHLHGARHAGVSDAAIEDALRQISDLLGTAGLSRVMHLWSRVRNGTASSAPNVSA